MDWLLDIAMWDLFTTILFLIGVAAIPSVGPMFFCNYFLKEIADLRKRLDGFKISMDGAKTSISSLWDTVRSIEDRMREHLTRQISISLDNQKPCECMSFTGALNKKFDDSLATFKNKTTHTQSDIRSLETKYIVLDNDLEKQKKYTKNLEDRIKNLESNILEGLIRGIPDPKAKKGHKSTETT